MNNTAKIWIGLDIANAPDGHYVEFSKQQGMRNYFFETRNKQREFMAEHNDRWVFGPLPINDRGDTNGY